MKEVTYTLDQLVAETGFSNKHNIRHYMRELGIVSQGTAGRNASYPKSVRDKLVFYAMLRQMAEYLTLPEVKKILESIPESMIGRVADGDEPLEIGDMRSTEGFRDFKVRSKKGNNDQNVIAVTLEGSKEKIVQSNDLFGHSRLKGQSESVDDWKRIILHEDIELRVRGNIADNKLHQLKLLGELVQSILKEE
jgi:hypothetical protein